MKLNSLPDSHWWVGVDMERGKGGNCNKGNLQMSQKPRVKQALHFPLSGEMNESIHRENNKTIVKQLHHQN